MTTSLQGTNAAAVLEAKGLVKRYGALPAVQNVSVHLHAGEVLGCVGPNGAGKSTFFKMLTCEMPPTSGHIIFHGRDMPTKLPSFSRERAQRKAPTSGLS
jgi:branched-chain amino acid transport system permease protein